MKIEEPRGGGGGGRRYGSNKTDLCVCRSVVR